MQTSRSKCCPKCRTEKPREEFHKRVRSSDGLATYCRSCKSVWKRAYHRKDPRPSMLQGAKRRARTFGLPFDLKVDDIALPPRCPVLGVKFTVSDKRGSGPHSATLDRIIPEKGYVRGNVVVVSALANRIKQDATVEQLERVASFYRQFLA